MTGAPGGGAGLAMRTSVLSARPRPSTWTSAASGTVTIAVPSTACSSISTSGPGRTALRKSIAVVPAMVTKRLCGPSRRRPPCVALETTTRWLWGGAAGGAGAGRSPVSRSSWPRVVAA